MQNATQQILQAFYDGKSLTGLDILINFGIKRESSVVHKLRLKGHNIITTMITTNTNKRVAMYSIPPKNGKEDKKE